MRKEDDAVIGEVYGEVGVGVMRRQVARMLSLDVDGLGFHEGAERNPVVRGLQQRHPGLRPVCLHTRRTRRLGPFIGHCVRVAQAVRVKARMAEELGPRVRAESKTEHAFHGSSRLAGAEGFPRLIV